MKSSLSSEKFVRAIAHGLRAIGLKRMAWNLNFSLGPQYGGPAPKLADLLSRMARGGKIVEHGCGIGTLPGQLNSAAFCGYIGYDISDKAIRVANAQHLNKCRFERLSMEAWMGECPPVDLIVCKEVLCYLSETAQCRFIQTAIQSLCEGGTLVVTLHDRKKHAQAVRMCQDLGATEMHPDSPVILAFNKK